MTVTWQGVCAAVTTQFYADDAINCATTVKMIDELNNEGVHGMIVMAKEQTADVSLYSQVMASPINLTKFKLD